MPINTSPPIISALEFNFEPNTEPILTPKKESKKVTRPIAKTAHKIFTFKKANVIPTANASMLVGLVTVRYFTVG